MYIKASFENIISSHHLKQTKVIGGSSSVTLNVEGLPIKKINVENTKCTNKSKVKAIVIKCFNYYAEGEIIFVCNQEFNYLFENGFVIKFASEFKLNKNKVRNKIYAYAHLKKSKRFMAFYSISFPNKMDDQDIRKIHNTCLTRIRKFRKSFSYIWVAERQKNGTLHFHMLTNEWFNIRMINRYYAIAIQNHITKNNLNHINFNVKRYNGVDVKLVKSIESLSKYLTKYVTKNNEKFNGLVWNCDSSISALVTCLYLNNEEYKAISKNLIHYTTIKKEITYLKEPLEIDIWLYGSHRPKLIFESLKQINEYIVKYLVR